MCQQPWAFLFLCKILSHCVSYSCSKTLAYGKKKTVFTISQDVSNTHGFVCTCLYIRISFRKRALIRKASKTSNDIRFCEEPKTIVVVDKWFNSLNLTHILLFNLNRPWKRFVKNTSLWGFQQVLKIWLHVQNYIIFGVIE